MKYFLVITLVLIVITVYFIFMPEEAYLIQNIAVTNDKEDSKTADVQVSNSSDGDQRHIAMQQKYQQIDKSRRNLEQRLSRMKAVLWGMEFSPEQSRKITEQLQSGYALLKNKKLLGAYRSVEEIDDDLLKVEFIYRQILETEQMVRDMKKDQGQSNP